MATQSQLARYVEYVNQTVASWQHITTAPHRFGGIEFNLDTHEIGHIHRHGMVDILFSKAVREQLLADQKAEPHHLLPDTGWISYYLREEGDLPGALWLFRLAYLRHLRKVRRRDPQFALTFDLDHELSTLALSTPLQQQIEAGR